MRATHAALLALVMAALAVTPAEVCAWGGNTPIVDCNDTDATIHAGAAEILANGIDDNCNGLVDEVAGIPSSSPLDDDTDGTSVAQGDCNDHNSSVYPGRAESVGDRIDNDCDGLADEAADDTPSSDTSDQDGDGFPMANDRIFGDLFESGP